MAVLVAMRKMPRLSYVLLLALVVIVLFGLVQHSANVGYGRAMLSELRSIDANDSDGAGRSRIKTVQYTTADLATVADDLELSFLSRLDSGQVSHDDPQLVHFIRKYYLVPPSNESYNVETKLRDTSMGQAAVVNKILENQTNGFFVECGALDGETRSNTYFFERQLGWRGLLIEGDPNNFNLLLDKHRKVHSINACLSTKDKPMKVMFRQQFNVGKISEDDEDGARLASGAAPNGYAQVQCFPLYSMLLAMNVTRVDYFSLDVEGAELDVLRAIPFERLDIRTLSVEYIHDREGEAGVQTFMESRGYVAHSKVNNARMLANDIIFVKK